MPDDVIILGKECRVITLKSESAGEYLPPFVARKEVYTTTNWGRIANPTVM